METSVVNYLTTALMNLRRSLEVTPNARKIRTELLKSLLRTKACPYQEFGICGSVPMYFDRHGLLFSLFKAWPKFSGNWLYPVPHPTEPFDAAGAYYAAENKWEGEYGALRMELLDFCITELEDQLEFQFESCVRADTVELEFSAPFSTFMIVSNFKSKEPCALWCMGWEL